MLRLRPDSMQFLLVSALLVISYHYVVPATARHSVRRALSELSRRRSLAMLTLFIAVIVVRLAILPLLPVPIPGIHDEFSYLLMADTFAHGRLSNPPHPMWLSFETFHVNWFPRYASVYPPAQGAVMALGQLVGSPWFGVVLSAAAMCSAIYWTLCGWIPPRWALLGATLAGLKLAVASYWINSYWGGAVAAAGGALLVGALPRIRRHARVRDSVAFAAGLAILSNTRPYEGLFFSAPLVLAVAYDFFKKGHEEISRKQRWHNVALPLGIVLAANFVFIGYYNHNLTGSALVFPHTLNSEKYFTAAQFLWQKPGAEKQYNNARFEEFYNEWTRAEYGRTWKDALRVSDLKTDRLASTFLWPGAFLLLPGFWFAFRERKFRLLWLCGGLMLCGVYSVVWSNPHYAAPGTCVAILAIVQAIRQQNAAKWSLGLSAALLAQISVVMLAGGTAVAVAKSECDALRFTCHGDPSRAAIESQLRSLPGQHLIMMRYHGDDLNIHDEWVFNGADIDSQKVIWARELDAEQNRKLLAYYKGRTVWLVTTSDEGPFLHPYTPPAKTTPGRP